MTSLQLLNDLVCLHLKVFLIFNDPKVIAFTLFNDISWKNNSLLSKSSRTNLMNVLTFAVPKAIINARTLNMKTFFMN